MSSSKANQLVATSGSQKKKLDKLKVQNRRNWSAKREKKASTNEIKKIHDIIFPKLVGLQHKPLSGADTVGSLPKLNLKLDYIIITMIGDYKGSLINLNWRK